MQKNEIGKLGEKIACYYLKKKGYKIIDKNYFKKWSSVFKGELDVVAKKDKTIFFIEVKTLAFKGSVFRPEQNIDYVKKKKLIRLAQTWLDERKIPLDCDWQIDAVSVIINDNSGKAKIKHFRNI